MAQLDNNGLINATFKHLTPWARTFIACLLALAASAYYLGIPRLVDAYSNSIETRVRQDVQIDKLLQSMKSNNDRDDGQDLRIDSLESRIDDLDKP